MRAITVGPYIRVFALVPITSAALSCDTPGPVQPAANESVRAGHASIEDPSEVALVVGNFILRDPGNAILRYDGAGNFVDRLVPLGGEGGPRGGCCMAFGPDEHLYVSVAGLSVVNRFNGVTGEYLGQFIPTGSGGLSRPLVVVFGPDGNLYVGDLGSRSIRRYDGTTGAFIDHFVPPGSLGGPGSGDPQIFVFGPDGNLYVASPGLNRVRRFSGVDGSLIDDFVLGTAEAPVVSGVLFGPDGNFYVGMGNGVNRYDGRTGDFIDHFVPEGSGGLSVPVGFVFGPDGNLYVASPGSSGDGSILRYDGSTGEFIDAFVPSSEPNITGPRVLEFKSRITMCHRPPGQPGNERTISIGYLTAGDHVAHGDAVGACPG